MVLPQINNVFFVTSLLGLPTKWQRGAGCVFGVGAQSHSHSCERASARAIAINHLGSHSMNA